MEEREKALLWSLKDGKIVLGTKRSYTIFQIAVLSFVIRFLSVVLIILASVRILGGNQYGAIISLAIGVMIFIYGCRFRRISVEAKRAAMMEIMETMKKKQEKNEKGDTADLI